MGGRIGKEMGRGEYCWTGQAGRTSGGLFRLEVIRLAARDHVEVKPIPYDKERMREEKRMNEG